jgi:hypothetical protein
MDDYDAIIAHSWPAKKVVAGVVMNPANGKGWVPHSVLRSTLGALRVKYSGFGGVMGWEYFNSIAEEKKPSEGPWEWAGRITSALHR